MPKQAAAADPSFLRRIPPPFSMISGVEDEVDDSPLLFPRRNTCDLNNKIIFTAIVTLSFLGVLVIVFQLYVRCVLRRQASDTEITGRLGPAATTVSTEPPPKTGLDPIVIASLPIFVYNQTQEDYDDEECAVCLSFLEDQELARVLPNCNHIFHAECIDKWLTSHSTCPICRTEAEPRVRAQPREVPIISAAGAATATAPPLELVGASSDGGNGPCAGNKASSGSIYPLSSFRRILSTERSSRRLQCEIQEAGFEDIERQ